MDIAGQGRAEHLRRIQSISDAALAHLDLEQLLGALLDRIRDALKSDTAAFLLLDERTDELVARAARGLEESVERGTRIPLGRGFAGRIAAERRTITIDDVDHSEVLNPVLREKGVKSLLGAPLVVEGDVVGVVHVGRLTPSPFSGSDAELLQIAADRAALAIEHGRAYEAERAVTRRLTRLQAITDAALSHLSTDALLAELVVRARDILDADTSAILLLDESRNELVARAAAGLEEEVEAGVRIPVGGGFAGRVAAEQRVIAVGDVDHFEVLNPILREKGVKSLLGAPLLAHGRTLGVIHVGSLVPRVFTEDEEDLLRAAAERAALGLERALLHERLLRLDRVRNRFVAVASHELRTPATAILGGAVTLDARHGELDAEDDATLRRILAEQAQRLATLVDQLLDLSRLEAQSSTIRRERVNLRELLEVTISDITEEQRSDVRLDVSPDLEVDADPVVFGRVVSNLVVNALRHGAPPVEITATTNGSGDVQVVVEDAGAGIPDDVRHRLFDEFVRGADALGTPGSGLGLAIARSYAHAHGGDLVLDTGAGHGARFRFLLGQPA